MLMKPICFVVRGYNMEQGDLGIRITPQDTGSNLSAHYILKMLAVVFAGDQMFSVQNVDHLAYTLSFTLTTGYDMTFSIGSPL